MRNSSQSVYLISESETSTPAWCHQPSLTQLCVLMNMPWLCKAELRLGLAWGYSVLSVRLTVTLLAECELQFTQSYATVVRLNADDDDAKVG